MSIPHIGTDAASRLELVRGRITDACHRVGRDPDDVRLLAASKYAGAEGIRALADAGQTLFGENRVQQATAKMAEIAAGPAPPAKLEWHLIGHLQSNKARAAAKAFSMVQSVDSLNLAAELSRHAVASGEALPVLLQVNVDGDPAKHGFYTGRINAEFEAIARLEGLRVDGLMTIGALAASAEAARPTFAALGDLRDRLDAQGLARPLAQLSMGMSADFEVAIEEGATIVRVGSGLFEPEFK